MSPELKAAYSRECLQRPLSKRPKMVSRRIMLNAGQKYCRILNSEILSIFIKLQFVIKIFVLSICEWPLKTCLTVYGTMYGPN